MTLISSYGCVELTHPCKSRHNLGAGITRGQKMTTKVAVIGAGYMGSAIIRGLQNQPGVHLRVFDNDPRKIAQHIAHVKEASLLFRTPEKNEIVILAIPPQAFAQFCAFHKTLQNSVALVISVMAGIQIETIRSGLGCTKIVRAIPNTPCEIQEGMTIFTTSTEAIPCVETAHELLSRLGKTI